MTSTGQLQERRGRRPRILCMCGKNIGYRLAMFLMNRDLDVQFVVNAYEQPGAWYRTPRELSVPEIHEAEIAAFAPELIVVAFYDRLLPPSIFAPPRLGAWNLHLGDAERYRGAYPNVWALRNGDATYAVTIHRIDKGTDTGDILAKRSFPIGPDMTGRELYDTMVEEATSLFVDCFDSLLTGEALSRVHPQDSSRAETHYRRDLVHEIAVSEEVKNLVRALTFPPFPPPYFLIGNRRFLVIPEDAYASSEAGSEGRE